MFAKRFISFGAALPILLIIASLSGFARDQVISLAQEQEFSDARRAIEAAERAKAEKYAPETLKQAGDLLATAGKARSFQDSVKFTQASRLARAYAELAKAIAELKTEEEKLAQTHEELQKAGEEIERLKKSP
jgi:ubiquinone biosynthesis protein UbiJ